MFPIHCLSYPPGRFFVGL